MLPHVHFHHEVPELPTISFLHLDCPYAQTVSARRTSGALTGNSPGHSIALRPERGLRRHSRNGRITDKEHGS